MTSPTFIEQVQIRGFRSLADGHLAGLPMATVLIGANGSGKSNFIRFSEMLSWMVGPRKLAEFVERQGGTDDQLHRRFDDWVCRLESLGGRDRAGERQIDRPEGDC